MVDCTPLHKVSSQAQIVRFSSQKNIDVKSNLSSERRYDNSSKRYKHNRIEGAVEDYD